MKTCSLLISILLALAQAGSAQAPRFEDYRVREIYRGKPAPPVLSTPEARMFRTELTRQAASGPNFAGHFRLALWGCGAGCAMGAIIDARTGQVWFPGFRVEDAFDSQGRVSVDHTTDFQLDSELIVARGLVNERNTGTAYFRWYEGKLSLIRFDRYPNAG